MDDPEDGRVEVMRAPLVLSVLLLLAACGGGRGTPQESLESIRAALAAADGHRLDELHDEDSRTFRRNQIREWRALFEQAEPPLESLERSGVTAEEIRAGTLDDAAALLVLRRSELVRNGRWYQMAGVVEETRDGEDAAKLRVRGPDGRERDLWFRREPDGWAFDHHRTFRPF